ncbi:MAG: hypothetical protein ACXVGR_15595, partial [Mycobacteriaceae bacterium]
ATLAATLVGAIAAGAIAAGAMTLTAPAAHADKISEKTIKSECKDARGTYSTVVSRSSGERISACTYKDNEGNESTDYYKNGHYTGTEPS